MLWGRGNSYALFFLGIENDTHHSKECPIARLGIENDTQERRCHSRLFFATKIAENGKLLLTLSN